MNVEVMLSIAQVAERYDISEMSVRRAWYAGLFPAPIRLGRRMIRWRLTDLLRWEGEQRAVAPPNPSTEENEVRV